MAAKFGLMHIGKTGGTAIRYALENQVKSIEKVGLRLFAHRWTLKKVIQKGSAKKVIFFIREPTDRFVSSFNSRLRQGLPAHNSPWSSREKIAFQRFPTPNALAEGLSSWNFFRRRAARKAMHAIRHCRLAYEFYLTSPRLLEKQKERIFFIGEQEQLGSDFELLKTYFNLDPALTLPEDDVSAHRNPAHLETKLSPRARRNLQRYYKKDYAIYRWCKAHRDVLLRELTSALESGQRAERVQPKRRAEG